MPQAEDFASLRAYQAGFELGIIGSEVASSIVWCARYLFVARSSFFFLRSKRERGCVWNLILLRLLFQIVSIVIGRLAVNLPSRISGDVDVVEGKQVAD